MRYRETAVYVGPDGRHLTYPLRDGGTAPETFTSASGDVFTLAMIHQVPADLPAMRAVEMAVAS
jgi:hypothetical protein